MALDPTFLRAESSALGAIMRNAKLVVLTLVSAVTALGCSVRMNSHPEYAAAAPQPEAVETFSVPYRNAWDSNANDPQTERVRPASVAGNGAAEAVQSPNTAQPGRKPINTKKLLEERFGLH